MKAVTIKDVARVADVSVASVCRVIHQNGYVSADKRARVEAAVAQLGYRVLPSPSVPDVDAEKDAPNFIALFTMNNSHPLFSRISEGISRLACEENCYVSTIYADDRSNVDQIRRQMDGLLKVGVKGFVINALADNIDFLPIRKYLQGLPVPLVMIERAADVFNVSKVLINAREALFLAVQHLVKNNHQSIVFIGPKPVANVEKKRLEGFEYSLDVFGIRPLCAYVPIEYYGGVEGERAIERYLSDHPLPDALIAADEVLLGVLKAFYRLHIRVPDDVSLIGLDNTFSAFTAPSITTLAFPEKQMCSMALDMILHPACFNDEIRTAHEVTLSPYLIERQSVRCK